MLPLVDLHCHYCVKHENVVESFRRLAESEEIYRVAVCRAEREGHA